MKQKAEYRVGVGASSILLILVVLALTALSLLSIKAAQDNTALTERNVSMTLAYYEAAAKVQRTIADMDQKRLELDVTDSEALPAFRAYLANQLVPVLLLDDLTFTMTVNAGAEREVIVEGAVIPGAAGGISITRHELRNTAVFGQETDRLTVFLP